MRIMRIGSIRMIRIRPVKSQSDKSGSLVGFFFLKNKNTFLCNIWIWINTLNALIRAKREEKMMKKFQFKMCEENPKRIISGKTHKVRYM